MPTEINGKRIKEIVEKARKEGLPFPKYLMKVGDEGKFYSLNEAGRVWDCGQAPVEICGDALEEDFSIRAITEMEKAEISDIADEFSASK